MEKHRSNQSHLTKQKRANKKQQWQQFFAHKTSKRGKIVILRFIHSKSLLKKIEIVVITSFIILLNYTVMTFLLSNYFHLFISTHKIPWPNRPDKQLPTHWSFKNAILKPVRGRFHGWGTLALKETIGTSIETTHER